jgi:hypothetical protein
MSLRNTMFQLFCGYCVTVILLLLLWLLCLFLRGHRIPNSFIRLIRRVTFLVFPNLILRIIFIFVVVIITESPLSPPHVSTLPWLCDIRFVVNISRVSFLLYIASCPLFALLIFIPRKEILPYEFSQYLLWTSRHIRQLLVLQEFMCWNLVNYGILWLRMGKWRWMTKSWPM